MILPVIPIPQRSENWHIRTSSLNLVILYTWVKDLTGGDFGGRLDCCNYLYLLYFFQLFHHKKKRSDYFVARDVNEEPV